MLIYVFFTNTTYASRLNRYVLLLFGVLTVMLLVFKKITVYKPLRREHYLALTILFFLVINVLFSDGLVKSGYFYCTLFSTFMIIFVKWKSNIINNLIRCIEILVFVFTLTIYLNWLIPNLMTDYLSFLVLPGSRVVLYTEIAAGQYSGILSERACAAVATCVGIGLSFSKFLVFRKNKIKNLCLLVFYLLGLVLTGKRAPILIVGVAIICLLLMARYKEKGIKLPVFFLLGIVLVYLVINFFPPVQKIFERTNTLLNNGMELNGRDVLWELSFKMFFENPLIGCGINSYNTRFNQWGIWGTDWGSHAHNTYIQLLGEVGIIGTGLFIAFFCCCAYKNCKTSPK